MGWMPLMPDEYIYYSYYFRRQHIMPLNDERSSHVKFWPYVNGIGHRPLRVSLLQKQTMAAVREYLRHYLRFDDGKIFTAFTGRINTAYIILFAY